VTSGSIRNLTLAVASVSCSNSACLGLHRRLPNVVPIVHQHGCSQLGDDVALTREILSGLMANRNVDRSLIVGLGCESNQPDSLAQRARERGAVVSIVGIQASGGVAAAIEDGVTELQLMPARPVDTHTVCVGLMADSSAGQPGEWLVEAIGGLLPAAGYVVLVSPLPQMPAVAWSQHPSGVPAVWRSRRATPGEGVEAVAVAEAPWRQVRGGLTDVERLTALTACGAEVAVVVTAAGSPVGSPIAPTIKVSCSDEIDNLEDVIDVPFNRGRGLPERAVAAVDAVISGRPTAAELGAARDIAIWRIAPYF
jgi:altronate dehydratase